jgi:Zn finger protein HypA/HybF involved in hydrogenase expression
MYYSSESLKCSAHVTTDRSRLKVYNSNQVFLKDKQKFEIELYNPTSFKYLAKISFNGVLMSQSGIVLKPGERVYLQRYLDSNNKFIFETYEVEKSNLSLNAISKNGGLKIEFYKENITFSGYHMGSTVSTYINESCPGTYGVSGPSGITYTNYSSGSPYIGGLNTSSNFNSINCSSTLDTKIETGRVEKGEKSKQEFTSTTGDFSYFSENSVEYKLLPESAKPVEISKIRNYCTECGTRMKKETWKFCPGCGNKL